MAMFGSKLPRYGTPGIGDGLPGATPMVDPALTAPIPALEGAPVAEQAKSKPNWLGIISDGILAGVGAQPIYAPIMEKRRERQDALGDYQRKREDDWALWQKQQDYERANPKAVANDTVADFNFIASQIGHDAAKAYLQNLADGPPIAVDVANPDGSVTRQFLPRSSMQPKGGDPAQTSGPEWLSQFTPEEIQQMQGLAASRRSKSGVPSGSPLSPAAGSKIIGGKQYWSVGGKWYDNPEGR